MELCEYWHVTWRAGRASPYIRDDDEGCSIDVGSSSKKAHNTVEKLMEWIKTRKIMIVILELVVVVMLVLALVIVVVLVVVLVVVD